ncbi:hypothetical protein FQN57_002755 [Myotisia sp. PD_48]|nr:hypothetical protein FQN57_002755 [Myotisia sp. PD_48]
MAILAFENLYNQTTIGRLATSILNPSLEDPSQPTKQWIREDGELRLSFGQITEPRKHHFCRIVGKGNQ